MTANELRIGNYVMYAGDAEKVNCRIIEMFFNDKIELKAIDLTEEWLLKFGFKKDLGNDLFFDVNSNSFLIFQNNRIELLDEENNKCICFCKSVHQLQNLYFALTGEELTFKSE
jgi:hypothetical protein